jgi:hypothetical protein
LRLPAKGYYRIRVYFGLTALRAAAGVASLLSALALLFGLRRLRRSVHDAPAPVA